MDAFVNYQFRAYSDKAGYARIDELLAMHRDLYNAAVLERRYAREWIEKGGDPAKASVTYNSQSREFTAFRRESPEWRDHNRFIATGTLWRVEKAFQAFFRRLNAGEKPGYPRLKSYSRFRTLEPRGVPVNALRPVPGNDCLQLVIKGLPTLTISLKGRKIPDAQELKTIKITRKGNRCMVSLGYWEVREPLEKTGKAVGLDMRLGIARVVASDGRAWRAREFDVPQMKRLHRKMNRAKRGSKSRAKVVRQLNNFTDRARIRDLNECHRFTSQFVREHDFIAIEDLNIRDITRSARGTRDAPGENIALTADLNRRALAQTWGEIRRQLTYKAEWAGRKIVLVDPNSTSRTCSQCGHLRPVPQVSPTFRCSRCGVRGAAAHNASINILRLGIAPPGEGGNLTLHAPLDLVSIRALAWMRV